MRTWARWTAKAAMLAAGVLAAGVGSAGFAGASVHVTSGDNSILGGNQLNAPISVPVAVCGNAAALLGTALAGCQGDATVWQGDGHSLWLTSGDNSVGGGNQVNAPVKVPVSVCGNSAAVLGTSLAGCQGDATVVHQSAPWGDGSVHATSGDNSVGGGNQVNVPVKVPVAICGNAAALLGTALAGCQGDATVAHTTGYWSDGPTWITSGDNSILGGNQINAPISIPVTICGNAAAVLGTAIAGCQGDATVGDPAEAGLLVHDSYASGVVPGPSSLPLLSSLPLGAVQLGSLTPLSA